METTDFHSLPRRELQALCKKHKIPANLTNVAMADALVALFVEGAPGEDITAAQEQKKNMKASRTTTARQNASISKTGRSSRRGAAKGEETKEIDWIPLIELPDTPVVPSGRKTRAREAMKTPGMSVVDAIVDAKNHEEEEATVLNSKMASAKSMGSRKTVSFALGEDGEGERGFGIEVKKTPVAPRIRAEETELGRRGTSRSVSTRGTSRRRSGRLNAVPKMTDLSATEGHDDNKEVLISDKLEIVVAEVETSDSVIAHEDGQDEEGVQSREWIGSEEISENVNPTADVVEADAEEKSDDQLTAGDVTAGKEEAFELHHADSEGGDLTVSSAGALASENVSDSSPEVSEAVVEAVDSVVVDAVEPVEDAVDEAIVRGLDGIAAIDEEDVMVDVPEVQEVETLAEDINHVAEVIEEDVESSDDAARDCGATANGEMPEDLEELAGDLTVCFAGGLASENVRDSSPEVSEAVVEAVSSVVVYADEPVKGLDGTTAVDEEDIMDVPEVQKVEPIAEDIDHVAKVIEEDVESSDDANCAAGDDNGATTANDEMPEDLDEIAVDGEAGCDNAVDTDEVIVVGEAYEDVPQDGTVATLPVVVAHPVIEAADCGEEVDELMEILEDVSKTEEHPAGCDEEGGEGNDEPMEVAEEDIPADNSGSNDLPTEAACKGEIPVENTIDVVVCDVTPIAETGSEITITVSEDEFTVENYSVTEEAASCDNPSMVELETLACDVDSIVEAALRDVEQIVEAVTSDGSTGNAPVEEASLVEESPENPEVGNVELEQDELLPITEEQIIPSNTEPVNEVSELIQELHVPVQCSDDIALLSASCIIVETPEAPIDDEPILTTVEHVQIPMATPTKFATVEVPCSAKRSALRKKEAGVSDNKENAVAVLYSNNKQPVMDNGTDNMMEKNGLPTPAELERMSLRQLRKLLEALSAHDSNHKRHEDEMVLISGKKPQRKRTALATLPDNCLKSPQPGRC